jgi:hypothetical protein
LGWQAYRRYVQHNIHLTTEWQQITFSEVDARALTEQWELKSSRTFDAGWWLNGSEGVFFSGNAEVRIQGGHPEIRNISAAWRWHDQIHAQTGSGTNLLREAIWHYTVEAILQTAFFVEITWSDKQPQEQRLDVNK